MSKKTEIVKSIALTVLVAMSIVLFANSWVTEWSQSDNETDTVISKIISWAGLENLFGYSGEVLPGTDIIAPATVVFTYGTKRIITNKGTDMYSNTYGDILSVFSCVGKPADAAVETDSEEWYYAQKNQSVYLDYGVSLKRRVLEAGIGENLPSELSAVDSVVFASNDSATNKLVIFFHDPETEKFYKLLTTESAKGVERILQSLRGYKNIPLAAELGFNSSPEEGYGQQLVINGNNIINLEEERSAVPNYVKIEEAAQTLDNSEMSHLLALFGMSESSAKQYAASSGAYMYIDTHATLGFSEGPSGTVMEYVAANNQKGAQYKDYDSSADILYNMACGAYSRAYSVAEMFLISNVSLRISSDITASVADESGNMTVYIDYCYNGLPLYFEEDGLAQHAVTLRFNSAGELIYYKQTLFDVTESYDMAEFMPVMNTIDKIYSLKDNPLETMFVDDIFKGYSLSGNEIKPIWCVRFKAEDKVYIVN